MSVQEIYTKRKIKPQTLTHDTPPIDSQAELIECQVNLVDHLHTEIRNPTLKFCMSK